MQKGLLLLNLGTPDAPTAEKVRAYLKEFLMDPFVIDIPWAMRWLLVHGAILPRRPARSAEAYRKIWSERGSPLLEHLEGLVEQVKKNLPPEEWKVLGAMRYGRPSIEAALEELKRSGIRELVVLPLYPQYSLAATQSSVARVRELAARLAPGLVLRFVPPFYGENGFLDAFAQVAREELRGFDYDHLLFSFHGLPERQIKKTDRSGGAHCLQKMDCCSQLGEANRHCYRAQCYATARGLAGRLGLEPDRYTVCFQSRLGRTPWIQPLTDVMYEELARRGVKRVAVMCPAFVADCLETLEEVRIRGREDFKRRGGEELILISSLNSSPAWAETVAGLARAAIHAYKGALA